jgi:hypothetical protein
VQGRREFLGVIGPDSHDVFDVVFLIEVIEHILEEDFQPALERLRAFVAPHGRIIVSTPNNEDLALGSTYCPVCNQLFHRWQHVRSFTPELLEKTFEQYGFRRRFLGLVDFSEDWPVYDAFKDAVQQDKLVREHLKTHPESARLERQFAAMQDILADFPAQRIDEAIRRLTSPRRRGLLGWANAMLFQSRINTELVSLLGSVAHLCKRLEMHAGGALRLLADPAVAHVRAPRADPSPEACDLRRGRESTIVYVGERLS